MKEKQVRAPDLDKYLEGFRWMVGVTIRAVEDTIRAINSLFRENLILLRRMIVIENRKSGMAMTAATLGWWNAGVCVVAFVTLWFTVSYRKLSAKNTSLEVISEQVQIHHRLYMQERGE